MPPQSTARLPGLDTLRALAILLVLVYHLAYALPASFYVVGQFGWMGVDLFFVLSGYLIGAQMLSEHVHSGRINVGRFYRRRAFRILPAYFVVLFLYFFVPQWREQPGLAPWWKFLTFTENLFFHPEERAFSHVWSLCVEEHFYLALPLLVAVLMRRPSVRRTCTVIAVVVLGGIGLRAYALSSGADFMARIYYPTYMRLDGLVMGLTLATIRTFCAGLWAGLARHGHATLAFGICLIAPVVWMFHGDTMGDASGRGAWGMIVGLPILAVGLSLVVASAVSRNGVLSRWHVPGARATALLAFSLYLSHKAVAHVLGIAMPNLSQSRDAVAIFFYAGGCLAVAALLYFGIERPFLALRDRMERRTFPRLTQEEPATIEGGAGSAG